MFNVFGLQGYSFASADSWCVQFQMFEGLLALTTDH